MMRLDPGTHGLDSIDASVTIAGRTDRWVELHNPHRLEIGTFAGTFTTYTLAPVGTYATRT